MNIGLLLLFTHPFDECMNTLWLPLTAVPYFFLYGRDLVRIKYRWSDLFRVYALNLVLIPVNLGGVFKSISQAITGRQIPFGRTPKVDGRTAVPRIYVLAVLALAAWCVGFAVFDVTVQRWWHALFGAMNGAFLLYGITRFMGWRESFADIGLLSDTSAGAATFRLADVHTIHSITLMEQRRTERRQFASASIFPAMCRRSGERRRGNFTNLYLPDAVAQQA